MTTNTTTFFTADMPEVAEGENWAQTATQAWIAEHGGTDITGNLPDGDYGTWAGDVLTDDGRVFRLEIHEAQRTVWAWEVEVVLLPEDHDPTIPEFHVWSGADWIAETRPEAAIMDDCTEGGFVADRFVSRVTELAV